MPRRYGSGSIRISSSSPPRIWMDPTPGACCRRDLISRSHNRFSSGMVRVPRGNTPIYNTGFSVGFTGNTIGRDAPSGSSRAAISAISRACIPACLMSVPQVKESSIIEIPSREDDEIFFNPASEDTVSSTGMVMSSRTSFAGKPP